MNHYPNQWAELLRSQRVLAKSDSYSDYPYQNRISAEFDTASRKWSKQQVLMFIANTFRQKKMYEDAVKTLKSVIITDKMTNWSSIALRAMHDVIKENYRDTTLSKKIDREEFSNYCKSLSDSSGKSSLKSISNLILAQEYLKNDINSAKSCYEKVVEENNGEKEEVMALYGLFNLYFYKERNIILAKSVYDRMVLRYPEDILTQAAGRIFDVDKKSMLKKSAAFASVNKLVNNIPKEYKLHQNYPNPFNPNTKINYSLKEPGFINLKIYNILGEVVKNLVNSYQSEGNYEAVFEGKGLSSGMYIYRIEAKGDDGSLKFTDVKKMLLVK